MTLTELIAHLQRLEAEGHGNLRVVVYNGYDSEAEILRDPPEVDRESYVWETRAPVRLLTEEDTYLIIG